MIESDRTMMVHTSGEAFVFTEEEVDHVLELGSKADSREEAWDLLEEYGREVRERRHGG